jgi:hypothetical protein
MEEVTCNNTNMASSLFRNKKKKSKYSLVEASYNKQNRIVVAPVHSRTLPRSSSACPWTHATQQRLQSQNNLRFVAVGEESLIWSDVLCWDRPSALTEIDRRLLLGSTVSSEKRSDAQSHTANRRRWTVAETRVAPKRSSAHTLPYVFLFASPTTMSTGCFYS